MTGKKTDNEIISLVRVPRSFKVRRWEAAGLNMFYYISEGYEFIGIIDFILCMRTHHRSRRHYIILHGFWFFTGTNIFDLVQQCHENGILEAEFGLLIYFVHLNGRNEVSKND